MSTIRDNCGTLYLKYRIWGITLPYTDIWNTSSNEFKSMIIHHINNISPNDHKAELVSISNGCSD
ncbi:hypothetical protein PR048_021081 [Dryococelus australis]|uniref:Uncharacterized protein n=1 Tax=Dryococelus australis TaxID=614101 RepID=A0ABQ9GXC0_9NEOP|nr:hypothetical protein PR048_021081 [Dryococelus australis]